MTLTVKGDGMTYTKPWLKCLAKIQQFATLPTKKWTHYQLLGYLLSQTQSKFEQVILDEPAAGYVTNKITCPSNHPALESMRQVLLHFNKSPRETKLFLDYCLGKFGQKLNYKGLRFLLSQYDLAAQPIVNVTIPDRTDILPDAIRNALSDLPNCENYGQLVFWMSIDNYEEYIETKLNQIGSSIDKLKAREIT